METIIGENREGISTINKTLFNYIIVLDGTETPADLPMFFVGGRTEYTYWCYDTLRALKYNFKEEAEERCKILQNSRGYKKCYVKQITQKLNFDVPAIYHKKIKAVKSHTCSDKFLKTINK